MKEQPITKTSFPARQQTAGAVLQAARLEVAIDSRGFYDDVAVVDLQVWSEAGRTILSLGAATARALGETLLASATESEAMAAKNDALRLARETRENQRGGVVDAKSESGGEAR